MFPILNRPSSKYSTFGNERKSGNMADSTSESMNIPIFNTIKDNKIVKKSKLRDCLCFCCDRCKSKSDTSLGEDVNAHFAMVRTEFSKRFEAPSTPIAAAAVNRKEAEDRNKVSEDEKKEAEDRNKVAEDKKKEAEDRKKETDEKKEVTEARSPPITPDAAKSLDASRASTLRKSSGSTKFMNEIYTAEILTATPRATLPRRSNSPAPHHEQEDDLDRLVGLHHNRSGLVGRSESMASVYSGAGDGARGSVTVRGAAQFSLLYNYRQGALEVAVRRCRDLAPVDVKRNRSDPYVKVYLLPDKSKCGKRKTKVKKNTLNPIFDETLRFVQPLSALSGRTLWLSVWHADMFGRNDFLGEVTLPLGDIVFDDPTPKWYNLQERTEQFEEHHGTKGDLIVGLKFELPDQNASPNNRTKGTLHVLVKEAKNLCASKPNGLADAFCKSYLLPERGRGAKQKTAVSRRTLSPRWETCFTYRALSLSDLQQRALELSVWDRDLLSSNDFMGGVRFSLGTGTYLGANVDWMDSMGKELTLWQTMMQRPNFWVEGSVPLRSSLSN